MITALPYLALVALATPFEAPTGTIIGFWALAVAAWWMLEGRKDTPDTETIPKGVIIVPIALIAATRSAPLMKWGWQGLGADSAAYRMNFGKCLETISSCAESPVSLTTYALRAIGIPHDLFAPTIALGAQALLITAIYFTAKEIFGKKAAFWSTAIFAMSVPQFVVYWSLFLNMEIAIALSLFGIIAYGRKSYWAIVMASAAGIFHFVAFVPLAGALIAMVVADKEKRRYAGTVLIASSLIAMAYQAPHIGGYAESAAGYALGALGNGKELFLAGHFVPLSVYHGALMIFYLPLGLIGIVRTIRKKRPEILTAYALMTLALVATRGIFHNRFIILFDIACIIFTGYGMERLWASMPKTKVNGMIAGMAALLLALNIGNQSMRMEPLVDRAEFAEIRALEGQFAGMTIFVNDPVYRQFVEGYSGHPVIAGEFSREPWRLLDKPSLIYNARRSTPFNPGLDPRAERISNRFWKYE